MTAEADAASVLEAAQRALTDGTDPTFREGATLLQRAADLGNGEAQGRLAYFTALGLHAPPDWDRAVAMLRRAADLGWTQAQDELALLSDAQGAIDIRVLVSPRRVQVVHAAQRIHVIPGLFSKQECDWLIRRAAGRTTRARVHDLSKAGALVVDERSNTQLPFTVLEADIALTFLRARIANTLGMGLPLMEPASVLHYEVGQRFAEHYDHFNPAIPGHAADIAERGQRMATVLVALNDAYEGGETHFPKLGWRWRGRTGDGLVWANVTREGAIDETTLHAGLPPTSGEKWLLSQWVRDRPQR